MSNDSDRELQPQDANPSRSGFWKHIKNVVVSTEREFVFLKGLSFLGFLGALLAAYFQFLSAYQDKVAAQAKEDLNATTATFTEISNAFSEAQTLQQILYFDYARALHDNSATNEQALTTKNARDTFSTYNKARTSLRQNIDVLARKAEIYIDWASNLTRDPAAARDVEGDLMNRTILGAYNFDCDDKNNLPRFGTVNAKVKNVISAKSGENICAKGTGINDESDKPYVHLCARDNNGKIIPNKPPIKIDWFSAKHHVMTMHYCFEGTHMALQSAREWASKSDVNVKLAEKFKSKQKDIEDTLDLQVQRLNAFMSMAMFQIEKIRVKYRPVGFWCHVPFVRELLDLRGYLIETFFRVPDRACSPIRTAQIGSVS